MATVTLRPTANSSVMCHASAGANYSCVDETSADDSDYVYVHQDDTDKIDIYTMSDTGVSLGTITSVVSYARIQSPVYSGGIQFRAVVGGTTYVSGSYWSTDEWTLVSHTWSGPTFTFANLDSMTAGFWLTYPVPVGENRCSQFYMIVTYTPASAPTVTSSAATNKLFTSVTGNGNVTSDGGVTVTERGICYGTSTNPTIAGDKITIAGTTGAMSGSITGLSPGVGYYYRGYATNSIGTSYGSNVVFSTFRPRMLFF